MKLINDTISGARLGNFITFRNMTVFPLLGHHRANALPTDICKYALASRQVQTITPKSRIRSGVSFRYGDYTASDTAWPAATH
jgi:hypothetical protein